MVCTTAFLHALRQRWPRAEIHVLANKYNRAVLEGSRDITAVHTYVYSKQCDRNDRRGRLNALIDRARQVFRLRRLAFDLVIVPNGGMHKNSIQFARQLRAKEYRWHDARTEFDDRKPEHVANRPIRHEALSGFALMPELPLASLDTLRLRVSPDAALRAKWEADLVLTGRPRVGLFVSNKAEQRRWDLRKWHELAQLLAECVDVVAFVDPGESRPIESLMPAHTRVVAPPTVSDLIAAMSVLDLVVSADSAPVHFASALGRPVVAMFEDRREKYLRWHPVGVPHVLLHTGRQVDDISVAQVAVAAHSLLDERVSA